MIRFAAPRFGAPVLPVFCALMAACFALAADAGAQTSTPAKPAKPAASAAKSAEGKTLTLGGGTGTGKLLTRDELRSCIKQQDSLGSRRNELEAARGPLDNEKTDLLKEQEQLKAEREKVDSARQTVSDLNTRYKAFGERVDKYNERIKALPQKSGDAALQERKDLDAERVELQALQPQLEAERAKVGDGAQQTVAAFNERAQALDQKVANWNQRNAAHAERALAVNHDRDNWLADCAERRYREDDEIALRRGQ